MTDKKNGNNKDHTKTHNNVITFLKFRNAKIPITIELLSMFGLTIISLAVSINLITIKIDELNQSFSAEEITTEIKDAVISEVKTEIEELLVEGDINQDIESLEQTIENLEQVTNQTIIPELTEIKEDIQNNWYVLNDNPLAAVPLHLLIQCIDIDTNEPLPECDIAIEIVEQNVIYEIQYEVSAGSPVYLPIQRDIKITASASGYADKIEDVTIIDSRETELILIFMTKVSQ